MNECKCEYCDGKMLEFYFVDGGEYALEACLDGEGHIRFYWQNFGYDVFHEDVPIAYCPFCGRKLAVE